MPNLSAFFLWQPSECGLDATLPIDRSRIAILVLCRVGTDVG